ncbi:unnamed protein product [Spodoptera exigua]|nr:unnamed protein product [Spodoptera exigua]
MWARAPSVCGSAARLTLATFSSMRKRAPAAVTCSTVALRRTSAASSRRTATSAAACWPSAGGWPSCRTRSASRTTNRSSPTSVTMRCDVRGAPPEAVAAAARLARRRAARRPRPRPPAPAPPPPRPAPPAPRPTPPHEAESPSSVIPSRCSRYQFACRRGGECIAVYNACDGVAQCADGSDEAPELGCPPSAPRTPPSTTHKPLHQERLAAEAALAGENVPGGEGPPPAEGAAGGEGGALPERWPHRLAQAQPPRRYSETGASSHIFSHKGGLLQEPEGGAQFPAFEPPWPRRAWPPAPPQPNGNLTCHTLGYFNPSLSHTSEQLPSLSGQRSGVLP